MKHYTPPDLEPALQAFHDLYNVLEPDNDFDTLDRIKGGLKYCIHNNVEPDQAIIDISECEPYVNIK